MKTLLLIILFAAIIFPQSNLSQQDTLIYRNGKIITGEVKLIKEATIDFFNIAEGLTYEIKKSSIAKIILKSDKQIQFFIDEKTAPAKDEDGFMEFIKDVYSIVKDLQLLIGILISGVCIALLLAKWERSQKQTITESKRVDRYRLSAIKERLEKHQEAFRIWYKLSFLLHSDKKVDLAKEARNFWVENCLYLTPKCRSTFNEFINLFDNYDIQREIWKQANPKDKEDKKNELISSFNKIMSVGRVIQEEVDISYTEPKSITEFREKEIEKLKV